MRTSDKFPWELLKAECLRLVCAQLIEASDDIQTSFRPGRKEEMVAFLQDVHERGVLKALDSMEPPKTPKRPVSSAQLATPSKRKSPPVDGEEDAEGESDNEDVEGYNTRYKGVKRVKVHGPSPEAPEPKPKRKIGRPRKSAPVTESGSVVEVRKRGRPRKNVSVSDGAIKVSKGKGKPLEDVEGDGEAAPSISRGRGRPRKHPIVNGGAPKSGPAKQPLQSIGANAPKSKDSGREIFDGIVLVKRSKNGKEKTAGTTDQGNVGGDVVPTGDNDEGEGDGDEEDAVLAAVNGDVNGDLSSLGGSNKENEISATYTPAPEEDQHEGDMDADGEFEADAEA